MKVVLFLIDTFQVGGAEKSISIIAENFTSYKPVFVSLYQNPERTELVSFNSEIERIDLEVEGKFDFGKIVERLTPIYNKVNPSIVHSTLFRSDIVGRRMKKKFPDIPLINSFVNNTYSKARYQFLPFRQKMKVKLIEKIDAWSSNKVDLFISNSEAVKEINIRVLRIDREKVKVIHRGRKIGDELFSQEELTKVRESLNLINKNIILNVSRLLDRKGQLDLINAFPLIRKSHPQTVLVIAGEGPYRSTLEKKIKELKIEDHVLLLGNREDISTLLAIADIFVFPSYYEGLPGAVIEAMIAGTPIVCSNIPENQECIGREGALLFNPGNISEISRQINYALSHKSELKKNASRLILRAKEKFNVINVASLYEREYDKLSR